MDRVGTHIADQAYRTAAHFHALVKLLSYFHGAVCGKTEFSYRFLLQGGGGKWRSGEALLALLFDRDDLGFSLGVLFQKRKNFLLLGFVCDRKLGDFLALELSEFGLERLGAFV